MTSRRLNLSVQYACNQDGLPLRAQIRTWVRAALDVDGARGGQITVRLIDTEEGLELNRDYRGKDYPTNVLSFPAEVPDGILDIPLLGDLVICVPVVEREAREQGKTLEAHWAHLVIHGCLHLLGYDHLDEGPMKRQMREREEAIMSLLGLER